MTYNTGWTHEDSCITKSWPATTWERITHCSKHSRWDSLTLVSSSSHTQYKFELQTFICLWDSTTSVNTAGTSGCNTGRFIKHLRFNVPVNQHERLHSPACVWHTCLQVSEGLLRNFFRVITALLASHTFCSSCSLSLLDVLTLQQAKWVFTQSRWRDTINTHLTDYWLHLRFHQPLLVEWN